MNLREADAPEPRRLPSWIVTAGILVPSLGVVLGIVLLAWGRTRDGLLVLLVGIAWTLVVLLLL